MQRINVSYNCLSDDIVRISRSDPRIELDFQIRSQSYPERGVAPTMGAKEYSPKNKLVQAKNLYLTAVLLNGTKPITPHVIESRSHARSFPAALNRTRIFFHNTRGDHSKIASSFFLLFIYFSFVYSFVCLIFKEYSCSTFLFQRVRRDVSQ